MTTIGCLGLYVLCSIVGTLFWATFLAIGPLADEQMEGNGDEQ